MASSINASTAGAGGVITTADNSGVLNIQTAGSTAINVTSNQLVNIGTATSSGQLTVKAASGQGAPLNLLSTDAGANPQVVFTGNRTYQIGTGNSGSGFSNVLYFYDGTAGAERMRLTSTGVLYVGASSGALAGSILTVAAIPGVGQGVMTLINPAVQSWTVGPDGSGNFVIFNSAGSGVYLLNGGVAWVSQSDEHLKTDLTPILDGLAKVNSLRSVTGRFKTDEVGKSRAFLIAQDVQKVLPEAVDEMNGILGIQYTDTIPLLVASIKELSAKVDAQAAEIAALKAGV